MRVYLVIGLVCFLASITGCSSTKVEVKEGEFFTLNQRNVILRDLTRPVSINNEPTMYIYKTFPEELK